MAVVVSDLRPWSPAFTSSTAMVTPARNAAGARYRAAPGRGLRRRRDIPDLARETLRLGGRIDGEAHRPRDRSELARARAAEGARAVRDGRSLRADAEEQKRRAWEQLARLGDFLRRGRTHHRADRRQATRADDLSAPPVAVLGDELQDAAPVREPSVLDVPPARV